MQRLSLNKTALLISVVGLVTQFIAMLLPWFQIGERKRNSYEVIDAVVLFDPTDKNWASVVEIAWIMLPAVAGFALLIWIAGYIRIGVALTVLISLIIGGMGLAVMLRSAFQIGNFLALVGGLTTLVCLIGAKFVLGKPQQLGETKNSINKGMANE